MADHLLSQYIHQPTRRNNTLDLFLTNNPNLVIHTEADVTKLSDHNIVKISTTFDNSSTTGQPQRIEDHTFRKLNLHKADYSAINKDLSEVDWKSLKDQCCDHEFPEIFRLTVLQICELHAPQKTKDDKRYKYYIPTERRVLHRKKRKLKAID